MPFFRTFAAAFRTFEHCTLAAASPLTASLASEPGSTALEVRPIPDKGMG